MRGQKASVWAKGVTGPHPNYTLYTETYIPAPAESLCLLCFLVKGQWFINLATHLNHQGSSVNPSAEASSQLNQNLTGGDAGINTF